MSNGQHDDLDEFGFPPEAYTPLAAHAELEVPTPAVARTAATEQESDTETDRPTLPLSVDDLRMLRESGLTDATLHAAELSTATDVASIDRTLRRGGSFRAASLDALPQLVDGRGIWPGKRGRQRISGLRIPIYRPGESEPYTCRYRLRFPRVRTVWNPELRAHEIELDKNGDPDPIKYESVSGVPPAVYYGPRSRVLAALRDVTLPLYYCEGEKKSLCIEQTGRIVVGLTGIWNWGDKQKRKAYALANGVDRKFLHPDIERFVALQGRDVTILFDRSDRVRPEEPRAARELAEVLRRDHGVARVRMIMPPSAATKGADDYYVARARRPAT